MQKWPYVAMGAMAGAIAVLTLALIHPSAGLVASAQVDPVKIPGEPTNGNGAAAGGGSRVSAAILSRGMGDPEMQLIAVPGMSVQGTQDSLWIIHKGATVPPPSDPKNPPPSRPTTDKLTLALYKIDKGGTVIKLVDVRDISYDLGMVQFEDDQKPSVKEVADKWKKANKGP